MHFYLRTTPTEATKVIISVSKKISKKAVVRNTIKRRLRPLLREITLELEPKTYMIVAKTGADKIKGQALREELAELFKKS